MKRFQNTLSMERKVWKPQEDDEKWIGNKSYKKKKSAKTMKFRAF